MSASNKYSEFSDHTNSTNETLLDDHGDSVDDVSPLPGGLGVGASASGKIETPNDVDAFAISLVANQSYTFDLKGLPSGSGTLQDPSLTLVDQSGKFVTYNFDRDLGELESRFTYSPSASGTFFLLAEGFSTLVGTYTISAALNATPGDDVLTGTLLSDRISGLLGNDTLNGGSGNDTLSGDAGNDRLFGGAGADRLDGGLGNDTYVLNDKDVVIEAAGGGIDAIRSSFSYALGANLENLALTGARAINGTGNALNNSITGNAAANLLKGGAGNDRLSGGAGADVLEGGAGADRLDGGLGNDTYVLNDKDVVIEAAGGGIDAIRSSFSYALGANLENLALTGARAINGTGNALNNSITGNAAANLLKGGAGNDRLSGGAGADVLEGGAGADRLDGGSGRDILSGGVGADRFVFTFATDIGVGTAARDVIHDFEVNVAGELIDLSRIDAITGGANNAFTFLGTAAFNQANDNGGLRYFQQNGNTIIQGSTDNDTAFEFEIELTGLRALTANDFVL